MNSRIDARCSGRPLTGVCAPDDFGCSVRLSHPAVHQRPWPAQRDNTRVTRPKHLLLAKEKVSRLVRLGLVGSRFIVSAPPLFFCFRKSPLVAYLPKNLFLRADRRGKNGHLKVARLQFFLCCKQWRRREGESAAPIRVLVGTTEANPHLVTGAKRPNWLNERSRDGHLQSVGTIPGDERGGT